MRKGTEREAGGTDGGRSLTGVPPAATAPPPAVGAGRSDPEVLEKPVRRGFTAEYKARILAEADACTEPGQLGALLRREGLYSSHLSTWRRQRDAGALSGLTPRKRGRKPKRSPVEQKCERLERENSQLREKLRKAELIIEVQKKLSQMLGDPQPVSREEATP